MKFIDPLASLQYMGGAIPIHFALWAYASYVYFFAYKKTNCDPVKDLYPAPPFDKAEFDSKNELILDTYNDVF
jgi:hypothetical protein